LLLYRKNVPALVHVAQMKGISGRDWRKLYLHEGTVTTAVQWAYSPTRNVFSYSTFVEGFLYVGIRWKEQIYRATNPNIPLKRSIWKFGRLRFLS